MPRIDLGPVSLSTYMVCYGAALLIAAMMALHRLVEGGIDPRIALRLWILTIWGGLLGSWVGYQMVFELAAVILTGSPAPLGRGTTVVGGVAGALLTAVLGCRFWRLELGRVVNLMVLPVPLGQAIGRLGCLAEGCCTGKPTTSWLGVELADANGLVFVRYPTQVMLVIANLMIFAVLVFIDRSDARSVNTRSGHLAVIYLALFCATRLVVGFFREGTPVVFGLAWDQLVAGSVLVIGAAAFLLRQATYSPE